MDEKQRTAGTVTIHYDDSGSQVDLVAQKHIDLPVVSSRTTACAPEERVVRQPFHKFQQEYMSTHYGCVHCQWTLQWSRPD